MKQPETTHPIFAKEERGIDYKPPTKTLQEVRDITITISPSVQLSLTKSSNGQIVQGKPNCQLSAKEREEKRRMKKRIKVQAKISSLKKTIRHANGRKDFKTEELAKDALNDLLEKEFDVIQEMKLDLNIQQDEKDCSNSELHEAELKERAKSIILEISNTLFQCMKVHEYDDRHHRSSDKKRQLVNGISLLKHMTKGTQEKDMFQDKSALWGYTRQKFYTRALLLCTSLAKIKISENDMCLDVTDDLDLNLQKQRTFQRKVWNVFQNGGIRKVCSIGCGPGNDFIGLMMAAN